MMTILDTKKINQKVEEIENDIQQTRAIKKEVDRKNKLKLRKELERLRVKGKKIREACREFHSWAMKNRVLPDFRMGKKHWWEIERKGWHLATHDAQDVWVIDHD